jgi:hypothetical protein
MNKLIKPLSQNNYLNLLSFSLVLVVSSRFSQRKWRLLKPLCRKLLLSAIIFMLQQNTNKKPTKADGGFERIVDFLLD